MTVGEAIKQLREEDQAAELVFALFQHGDTTLGQMKFYNRGFYEDLKIVGRDASVYSPSRAACVLTGKMIDLV